MRKQFVCSGFAAHVVGKSAAQGALHDCKNMRRHSGHYRSAPQAYKGAAFPSWMVTQKSKTKMNNFNAENERIKRDYAEFLREADQKSETTVRGVEKAILRFEEYTGYRDFERFNRDQAKGFRSALSAPADGSKRLGNSTVLSTLKAVQRSSDGYLCSPASNPRSTLMPSPTSTYRKRTYARRHLRPRSPHRPWIN